MPDILQALPIGAPIERVYDAITTPAGLDEWWTLRILRRFLEHGERVPYGKRLDV